MDLQDKATGIRGWLLFFVVLNILAILRTFFSTIPEEFSAIKDYPTFHDAVCIEVAILFIWGVFHTYCIYALVSIKENAIKLVKALLVLTPVFIVGLPLVFLFLMVMTIDGLSMNKDMIASMYTPEMLGEFVGCTIVSAIWYRYFCVSSSVENTWKMHQEKAENKETGLEFVSIGGKEEKTGKEKAIFIAVLLGMASGARSGGGIPVFGTEMFFGWLITMIVVAVVCYFLALFVMRLMKKL